MTIRFLHHGMYPGTDPLNHYRMAFQYQDFSPVTLITQPERGPGSDMIARSLAVTDSLPVDLQPYGWRLSRAAGIDQRRIDAALHLDSAALADAMQAEEIEEIPTLKLQFFGPVSLAASVHLPQGEKIISDHGAFRELLMEQSAGALGQLQRLNTEYSVHNFVIEIFEPSAALALEGRLPSASGYQRYRSIDRTAIVEAWQQLVDMVTSDNNEISGSVELVLNLAASSSWNTRKSMIPHTTPRTSWKFDDVTSQNFEVLVKLASEAGFDSLYIPPGLSSLQWETIASWVEDSHRVVLGADTDQPVNAYVDQLTQRWFQQGLSARSLANVDVASVIETLGLNETTHRKLITKGGELADALNQRANA